MQGLRGRHSGIGVFNGNDVGMINLRLIDEKRYTYKEVTNFAGEKSQSTPGQLFSKMDNGWCIHCPFSLFVLFSMAVMGFHWICCNVIVLRQNLFVSTHSFNNLDSLNDVALSTNDDFNNSTPNSRLMRRVCASL